MSSGEASRYSGDYENALSAASDGWAAMSELAGGSGEYEWADEVLRTEVAEGANDQAEPLRRRMAELGGKLAEARERDDEAEEFRPQFKDDFEDDDEVEATSEDGEVRAEGEHKDLDAWAETMRGSLDEYWDKRCDRAEWTRHGVAIGKRPEMGGLRDEVIRALNDWVPEVTLRAVNARVDMATKVAMKKFAEDKGEAMSKAKVKPQGFLSRSYARVMPKDYDKDEAKIVQREVRKDFYRIYRNDRFDLTTGLGDEMSEDELIAWRVALDGPEGMLDEWSSHPRRAEEGADEYYQRLERYLQPGQKREEQLKADAEYEANVVKQRKVGAEGTSTEKDKAIEMVDQEEIEWLSAEEAKAELIEAERMAEKMRSLVPENMPLVSAIGFYEKMCDALDVHVIGMRQESAAAQRVALRLAKQADAFRIEMMKARAELQLQGERGEQLKAGSRLEDADLDGYGYLSLAELEASGDLKSKGTPEEQLAEIDKRLEDVQQMIVEATRDMKPVDEHAENKMDNAMVLLVQLLSARRQLQAKVGQPKADA